MDSIKKPSTFGDMVRPTSPKTNSVKKVQEAHKNTLEIKPAIPKSIQSIVLKRSKNPLQKPFNNQDQSSKQVTNSQPSEETRKNQTKKISNLPFSSKKIGIQSSDLSYRLNDKEINPEQALIFKKTIPLKPNTIKYISQNKEINEFNNQALLFENSSIFGSFTKKIKSNKEVSGTPLLKKLAMKSIKKIPIESDQKLNSRLHLVNTHTNSTFKSFSYILAGIIIFILLITILAFNVLIGGNRITNASQNNTLLKIENIQLKKSDLEAYISSYKLPSNINIDTNQNGLSNWQDFYIGLNPVESKEICGSQNHKDLIYNLTNFETCQKIDINEDSENNSINLLKYFLYSANQDDVISEFSLIYVFGITDINEFEQNKDYLRLSGNDSVIDNLIKISKIDAYINSQISTFDKQVENPIDGVYYLEASINYNISLPKLLAFSKLVSNFGTEEGLINPYTHAKDDLIKSLNRSASLFKNIDTLEIPQCQKYLLLNPSLKNCNLIENTISDIHNNLN